MSGEKKIVYVTGTSRGLGFAISEKLLGQGFAVVGISRSEGKIDSEDYFHEIFDLRQTHEIHSFVKRLIGRYGIPYGLINNSGIGHSGILATQHDSEIADLLNVNLLAPILLTKYVSRKMMLRREGKIINIASIIGTTGYNALSVYGATKSGLIGFTKSLSREVGKLGIIVNSVSPGYLDTDMTTKIDSGNREKIIRRSPFNKLAGVEDVADFVLYLISINSHSLHGQNYIIDGGAVA